MYDVPSPDLLHLNTQTEMYVLAVHPNNLVWKNLCNFLTNDIIQTFITI